MGEDDAPVGLRRSPEFPATRWTLVTAAQGDDEADASAALSEICRTYWYPLYAYARRCGLSSHDAEDQTQEFFSQLLDRRALNHVSSDKGKLRSFLLAGMKNQLAQEWRRSQAKKRGGDQQFVFIDAEVGEQRFVTEPSSNDSPDALFEKNWANALLDRVLEKLTSYYEQLEKLSTFETLREFLAWNSGESSYRDVADRLGMTEGALRFAVHRMRKRYRTILEDEIRQTVTTSDEAAEELAHLRRVLSSAAA